MASCFSRPCGPDVECVLVGGCVAVRFGDAAVTTKPAEPELPKSKARNGVKPSKRTQKSRKP
jgi:hypothetical protein